MSLFTLVKSYIQLKFHEHYSRERILKLQEKKFRKILAFAYENSKFYHDFYSSNGINSENIKSIDIEKIPVINKTMMMDNFDDVLSVDDITKKEVLEFFNTSEDPNELFKNKYHIIHSSGSSGQLGFFVYSKKDWDSFYPYVTKLFDFNFRRTRSTFIGATGGHFSGNSYISWSKKGFARYFNTPLILDVNEPVDEVIEKLNGFQPHILGGYSNALKHLAKKQEEGVLRIKPRIITNCGEGINVKDREYIEEVFHAPMSNLYGFAECVVSGFGRASYGGIYLMDDLALIEIKSDHILLTNLYNITQPIIRYRIDDYVRENKDVEKKLPFTLIENIVGRAEFLIWLENDYGTLDFIHPLIFTDFYVEGLDKLQIAVKDKHSFEFRAVIISEDKEKVKKKITKKLDKILAKKKFTQVEYNIKELKEIPSDPKTGKFKLILKL